MGALVFDRCYADNDAAADAFFGAKEPSFTAGTTSFLSWYEKISGVWTIKRQSVSETGVVTTLASSSATVPAFPECDTAQMLTDGVAVGWLIAGVILAAWGIQQLRRLMQ